MSWLKLILAFILVFEFPNISSILALALERLRRGVRHNEKHHTTSLICFWFAFTVVSICVFTVFAVSM